MTAIFWATLLAMYIVNHLCKQEILPSAPTAKVLTEDFSRGTALLGGFYRASKSAFEDVVPAGSDKGAGRAGAPTGGPNLQESNLRLTPQVRVRNRL